jgi:hypothetical protein
VSTTTASSHFPARSERVQHAVPAAASGSVHAYPLLRAASSAVVLGAALGVDALIGQLPIWTIAKALLALPISFAAIVATLLLTGAAKLMRR